MAITTIMTVPQGLEGKRTFVCDATLSVAPSYSNNISNHPVEKSSNISDHAYNNNPIIRIEGVISNSYSQTDLFNNPSLTHVNNEVLYDGNRVYRALNLLEELWRERGVFTIVSEYKDYNYCIIKNLNTSFTKETSDVLVFSLVCEQVRFADSQQIIVTNLLEPVATDAEPSQSKNEVKKEVKEGELLLPKEIKRQVGSSDKGGK